MAMNSNWAPRIVPACEGDGTNRSRLLARLAVLARTDVVAIVATPAAVTPPPDELAVMVGHHLVVLVPAAGEAAAIARARVLLGGGGYGAGIAVAPFDGVDAAALLDSACAACDAAAAGEVVRVADAVARIALGKRVAIVADPSTAAAYALARRLASAEIPVTICGPTGTGKDLVATAIHELSPRAGGPFVPVNCAAIPEGLAEAELFGHAKGAFTGAVASRAGLIEASSGGTLFLDEVAELSRATQARLLRTLEAGEVQRIGETTRRTIDLHVVVATHRDLGEEVAAGRFRKDLWYRLGVARIDLAPLCERPRDLAALVRQFLADAHARSGRATPLAPATARALFAYSWPGNVRELRHAIEFAVAAATVHNAAQILPEHLPELRDETARPRVRVVGDASVASEMQLLERRRMIEALARCAGVQNKAAALIQMPLRTFVTKLKRYAISERDWCDA
jgi:two-component system response regulator AtoC